MEVLTSLSIGPITFQEEAAVRKFWFKKFEILNVIRETAGNISKIPILKIEIVKLFADFMGYVPSNLYKKNWNRVAKGKNLNS